MSDCGRRRLTAAALSCLLGVAGGAVAVTASPAHADPLGSARARASALEHSITTLTDQAEQASQRYDAIQGRLATAVSAQVSAQQNLAAAQAAATAARQQAAQRAQALFESGGSTSVLAAVLSGTDPADVTSTLGLAAHVVTRQQAGLAAAGTALHRAAGQAESTRRRAAAVTALQVDAQRAAASVSAALARQQSLWQAASATVRRLERAQRQAALAASTAQFRTAVHDAGGTLNDSGPTTASNPTAAAAIDAARTRLGDPYVWGGTGPTTFDCSGLTQWAYAHAGVSLPRTAAEQWGSGPHPSLAQLLPGDLLFWAFDPTDPATIHHVALYLGGGMMLAAPHTGTDVQVQPVYLDGYLGATRPWSATLSSS